MARLIKFTVIRNAGLWHQSEDLPVIDRGCHIVEFSKMFIRQTDKKERVELLRLFRDIDQRRFCLTQ